MVTWIRPPAIYGEIDYGQVKYGAQGLALQPIPVNIVGPQTAAIPIRAVTGPQDQWTAAPFIAQSLNYDAVGISWTKPLGVPSRWRLLRNRYGYPVDQNDGDLLLDQPDWPGTFYLDQAVIPGQYIYYGLYAQTDAASDVWRRVAVTGCLATADSGKADWLANHLPGYLTQYLNGSLTQDGLGIPYLTQFLSVLAWGLDYTQAQYDMLLGHLNDPMYMSISDLVSLAGTIGMPYDPEISVYLMRKAAANWGHVAQERGTPLGIQNQIELLTGFDVDLQIGQNLMLDGSQSYFPDPDYPAWDQVISYHAGEIVTYQGALYQCVTAGAGNVPTGAAWAVQSGVAEPTGLLNNPVTGGVGTFETIYPGLNNGLVQSGAPTMQEAIGAAGPQDNLANALQLTNREASAQDMILRTVARTVNDWSATASQPHGLNNSPILNSNWDFETGVSGWTATNGTLYGAPDDEATSWANTGNYSAALVASANNATASTTVAVLPGATYTVQGWFNLFADQAGVDCQIVVTYLDNAGATISSDNVVQSWTQTYEVASYQYLELTVPDTCFSMTVGIVMLGVDEGGNLDGSQINFDDFKIQAQNWVPDNTQAIGDGVPVPFTRPSQEWDATVRYGTGDIVTYNGQPFLALRASTGAVPTAGKTPTAEWAPLSSDQRLRLMVSTWAKGTDAIAIKPFVEWYDIWGQLITRVTARTPAAPGVPDSLGFDGFVLSPGNSVSGRSFDNSPSFAWDAVANNFTVSPYNNGVVFPNTSDSRSIMLTTGPSDGQIGVTIGSFPESGTNGCGIVFRYQDPSNYLAVEGFSTGTLSLLEMSGGTYTTLTTSPTLVNQGDRIVVQLNGASISVLLNGVQVITQTSSFNQQATQHGIVVE